MKKTFRGAMAVLIFAGFLATFNETIINVALLSIAEDFDVSLSSAQWLITGYMLISSVMVPVTAFLYQSIRTRRLFLLTMAFICLGALGCLAAYYLDLFPLMMAARLFQALGTGMMLPILTNTAMLIIPKERLGSTLAICICATSVGPAVSPVLSGMIVQYYHWSIIFVLLAALSALAFVLGAILVPNIAELTHPKLDILSVFLSTAGLAAVLYGLSILMSSLLPGAACLLAGLVLLAVFALRQHKLPQPMLNLTPLSNRRFLLGLVMVVTCMVVGFDLNAFMPSFLQEVRGVSSINSAFIILPGVLLNVVMTRLGGSIVDKHGPGGILTVGFVFMTFSLAVLAFIDTTSIFLYIIILHILIYQGVAMTQSPAQMVSLSRMPEELNAHAVSIINTFLLVFASLGSSLYIGIESAVEKSVLAQGGSEISAAAGGFNLALLATAAISAVGLIFALITWKIWKKEKN